MRVASSIIGIGLNVNQLDFDGFFATSLRAETSGFQPLLDVLDGLSYSLNQIISNTSSSNIDALEKKYYDYLLGYKKNQKFVDEEGEFQGEIFGVDQNGNLQVLRNGVLKSYGIKELRFIL